MRGTGKAFVYGMLAHPIGHAKSPGMFNELFEDRGLDSLMVPITCAPEHFDALWDGMTAMSNMRGIIISIPFKVPSLAKAVKAHPRASRVGAANILRRLPEGGWEADNFDGYGFINALKLRGYDFSGKTALQIGAGGAGCSIAFCLAEEGVTKLTLCDIDQDRANDLAQRVRSAFPSCNVVVGPNDPAGCDLVVNATPIGMKADDPLPVQVERLTKGTMVVDIIMEPAETRLLAEAKARGCDAQPGRPMMDQQLQAMADFLDAERTGADV